MSQAKNVIDERISKKEETKAINHNINEIIENKIGSDCSNEMNSIKASD